MCSEMFFWGFRSLSEKFSSWFQRKRGWEEGGEKRVETIERMW